MDLHFTTDVPTDDEREAVDAVLGADPAAAADGVARVAHQNRSTPERRSLVLPALHALQHREGWISPGGVNYVARRLGVPPAEVFGVASFYALFAVEKRPKTVVHVCDDVVCRVNGATEIALACREGIGPAHEENEGLMWIKSPCLGLCERAPAVLVQKAGKGRANEALAPATPQWVRASLDDQKIDLEPLPLVGPPTGRRLLARVGVVDPTSLDAYRALGGYAALRRAIDIGPALTIREIKDAKLLGRGGAAFPTGVKWEAVAQQPARPHHVVCNADESEPGTFKDRVVMEGDPFALVEAMTIAGFAMAAEKGYIYLRGEYPLAKARLENAIAKARTRGFLGDNVMGAGFKFDLELRCGAGAYICGEETALFNSLEGKRGEPRSKPPFPVTHGLFGKPTGINNVETLVNVNVILGMGAPAYAALGTPGSTGTRLFCVSGHIEKPGTYEVECGTPLSKLLDLAGGMRPGRKIKAILLGGAAGVLIGPNELDLPLSFEAARERGVTLGSGVVAVFDETVDLVDTLLRIAQFFRDESCGQCVPCRVGTVRQEEALHRIAQKRALGTVADEIQLLDEISQVMKDASICGLGQTAASVVSSAVTRLKLFNGGAA
ncbi:MAG: NAD(P)H-dependent oxidoreductase subunit E [Vicinamibacteria bacterium]|nr:NAD(P)H-dependent oxidoreductase subunit E [Vicinamibacteria bacterium]